MATTAATIDESDTYFDKYREIKNAAIKIRKKIGS